MPLGSDHLRRLAALNLPPEIMAEVLSIVADVQAIDEIRRATQRVRQARWRDCHRDNDVTTTCDSDGDSHASKESPQTPKENTTPEEPTNARARRATRITPDWQPLPNVVQLGLNLGFDNAGVSDQLERMKDHFTAKSGKDAAKHDWNATARNWLKRAADDHRKPSNGSRRPSPGETMRDAIRDVGEYIDRGHRKGSGSLS